MIGLTRLARPTPRRMRRSVIEQNSRGGIGDPMTVLLVNVNFAVCLVSALVPVVNAEAYLAGLGVLDQPAGIWLIAVVAAAGQTAGKVAF
jgi:hypothetical protein